MSQFSATNFDTKGYFSNRPTYPDSFYDSLDRYHKGLRRLAVDVGCGPGVATFQLASRLNSFDRIVGTDISSAMVERARSLKNNDSKQYVNVSFAISSGNEFSFLNADETDRHACDMITAAECVHWFEFDKFQKAAATNLRSGGTLAIWGYVDLFFLEYPKADQLVQDLTYGENELGPYWEQPGRNYLKNLCQDLHLDKTLFTDIEEGVFQEEDIRSKKHVKSEPVSLFMSQFLTLEEYKSFIKTWSGYHSWKECHPNAEKDIADQFVDRVLELYPELSRSSKIQVCARSFYKFARAR